eukprot:TRINITY_DN20062_c0_g1_i1.p1 TRINITY_DN20062_c0_g1~~TRINITY_DN20062_c0_g1_i1.p1  ORF type:complete len:126 (-),score=14.01 TRINITY_DN20062_c0_g1_i1:510-887(-)
MFQHVLRLKDVSREEGVFHDPIDLVSVQSLSYGTAIKRMVKTNLIPGLEKFSRVSLDFASDLSLEEKLPPSLTVDEAAAINLWTREWTKHEESLFCVLNNMLRHPHRRLLEPFLLYLKLLHSGNP